MYAIEKAHPGAKLKEAEKILKADGTVSGFEVEIKLGKKELEPTLGPSGAIVKTEEEKSDKDLSLPASGVHFPELG